MSVPMIFEIGEGIDSDDLWNFSFGRKDGASEQDRAIMRGGYYERRHEYSESVFSYISHT